MEQQKDNKFFSKNTRFGIFVGLSYMLVAWMYQRAGTNISLNPQLNKVIMMLSIAGAYLGVKKYRNENLNGAISYGGALGACVYVISVAALVYGCYTYYLYNHKPEMLKTYIDMTKALVEEAYKDTPLLDTMKTLIDTFMTPFAIAVAEVMNKVFTGFMFSLLLAGILRRRPRPEEETPSI